MKEILKKIWGEIWSAESLLDLVFVTLCILAAFFGHS